MLRLHRFIACLYYSAVLFLCIVGLTIFNLPNFDKINIDNSIHEETSPRRTIQRRQNKIHVQDIYIAGGAHTMYVKRGRNEFSACDVSECRIVDEKDAKIDEAHAVLFRDAISLSPRYHPNQIWILYTLENPFHTPKYTKYNGFVNWTATYRTDSDIVTPYAKFERLPTTLLSSSVTIEDVQRKSKLVAWFVSNCHTPNFRHRVAFSLQNHLPIDTYGACGTKNCRKNKDSCWNMLSREYKFYLSFENGNCDDYITEKFFENALQHSVVPIVFGATRQQYEAVAPPHSFIHVDDFASAAELAAYLRRLDEDDEEYLKYFDWRTQYASVDTKFWCRLCEKMHADEPMKTYDDLQTWWKVDRCRQKLPWGLQLDPHEMVDDRVTNSEDLI